MSEATLKAIETRFDGYRFRSRLEARWAVFFKTLGIPYEYEKEGFDLDGLWYLPDFWLPVHECWIEIKPDNSYLTGFTNSRGSRSLGYPQAARLARGSGKDVFVFEGTLFEPMRPWDTTREPDDLSNAGRKAYPVVWGRRWIPDSEDDEDWGVCYMWGECIGCLEEGQNEPFVGLHRADHWHRHSFSTGHDIQGWCDETRRMVTAFAAARSARFEHGENGRHR